MALSANEIDIQTVVQEVVKRLQTHLEVPAVPPAGEGTAPAPAPRSAARPVSGAACRDGVCATVDEAVIAAAEAQKRIEALSLNDRGAVIRLIKDLCTEHAAEWARLEMDETKIGRLDHKVDKLKIIANVPGVEMMRTDAIQQPSGLQVIAYAPWGVIAMITPATHSVPTMACNAISVIASGNAPVFSPHPAAARCLQHVLQVINREVRALTGIPNVLFTMAEPSIERTSELFHHKGVALICVTGGPSVVRAAMKSGKRVIAAGPGNPPVVVDETADLSAAARHIIAGASFDNNLLCIGEKEVFVVQSAADAFIAAMKRAGAVPLNTAQIDRLTQAAFTFEEGKGKGCARAHVHRDFVGRGADVLARAAGIQLPAGTDLLFGETGEDHPFVQEEQMMPFLPIVRVRDFDDAVRASLKAEHGYRHTAIVHSNDAARVTRMAKAMNTTLFIQNAPSFASLGSDGPGYLSYSIATPTGEGVTTPLTFTRQRQLTIGHTLNFA